MDLGQLGPSGLHRQRCLRRGIEDGQASSSQPEPMNLLNPSTANEGFGVATPQNLLRGLDYDGTSEYEGTLGNTTSGHKGPYMILNDAQDRSR